MSTQEAVMERRNKRAEVLAKLSKKYLDKHIRSTVSDIVDSIKSKNEKILEVCELGTGDAMHSFLDEMRLKVHANRVMSMQREYQNIFSSILKEFGVTSPADLNDKNKEEFFNKVLSLWYKQDSEDEDESEQVSDE